MDGGSMSGWMGALNDWFTNEGFSAYTVANKQLLRRRRNSNPVHLQRLRCRPGRRFQRLFQEAQDLTFSRTLSPGFRFRHQ